VNAPKESRMRGPRRNVLRLVLPLVVCGLCVPLVGCASKPTPTPAGGATSSKAEKAPKDAEALALSAVIGAGDAQAKAVPASAHRGPVEVNFANIRLDLTPKGTGPVDDGKGVAQDTKKGVGPVSVAAKGPPTPKLAPRPGPAPVIRERVVSAISYATEAEAEEDALAQARDVVEQKLLALDPPVRHKPSISEVKAEFIRKDSRTVRQPDADEKEKEVLAGYGMSDNRVFVEYDVEVTAEQVRELRSQERVAAGMRVLGVVVAVALAGFLFLRADEWTKGYLTHWLALGAALLAGGAAAVLIFV